MRSMASTCCQMRASAVWVSVCGWAKRASSSGREVSGFRQRAPVNLAIGVDRQGVQFHPRGRHHVVWQPLLQMLAQLGDGGARAAGARHHIRDQALASTVRGRARFHHRGGHGRMRRQQCFDLSQLDAEAADLDLMIEAAEKLDGAIGAPAAQIACLVEADGRAGTDGERNGSW